MAQRLWGAAIFITFWACGSQDAHPGGATGGAAGKAATATGGDASLAGAGAEPNGGSPDSLGGASVSLGGAAAGTESSSAGQPTAGEAGATSVQECDPNACQNGGHCPASGGTTCDCPDAFTGTHCELPRFEVLALPNGATVGVAAGLSADGSVVVGNTGTASAQAGFRWTHAGGLLLLDALPSQSGSAATAVSADGQVIIGRSGAQSEAVYWPAGKTQPGSLLNAAWKSLQVTQVSADGSVIAGVGTLTGGQSAPFRWTKAGGAVALGNSNAQTVTVVGMSADGSVIVGNAGDATPTGFIWKVAAPLSLAALAPLDGDDRTNILALSADGSIAVGDSIQGAKSRRVRWLSNGKPVLLDPLDSGTAWGCGGGPFTTCTSTSRDGSVIYTQRGGIAQRWTQAKGLEAMPVLPQKFNCAAFSPQLPKLDWIAGNCIGPPVAVVWDHQGQPSRLGAVLATFGVNAPELSNATITAVRAVSTSGDTILGDNFNVPVVWVARVLR